MSQRPNLTYADLVRLARAFIMTALVADAVALRPGKPRARGPLTPLAEKIFHILVYHFENVLTGLCNPSLATIKQTAGCAESSVKLLLLALSRTEYLTWRPGKRKRVKTRKGWRVVRGSNRYRVLCPTRHLAALRRVLIKAADGRHGPLIQAVISRFTPPTEEAREAEKIVSSLAAELRPHPQRMTASPAPEGPARAPPGATTGPVEVGGVQVEDPTLGAILSKLFAALEQREEGGQ